MNFFDNLITHERDLSFRLQSSLEIHTLAFNFRHLAGGTVPSLGWRLARYRPRRHLATDYALRWRGWISEKSMVARRRHRTPDRPRRGDEPNTGDSSSCILYSVQRRDTMRRYRWEALLALELTRSWLLCSERHHITAPVTISVPYIGRENSLSPPE